MSTAATDHSKYIKVIISISIMKILSIDVGMKNLAYCLFNISDENFNTNESLYDFGGKKVLEVIKNISNSLDCVLIVGHNHALTSLANMLGDISIINIPTCGFVEIQFNVEKWEHINYGQTTNIIFPRDLKIKQ